LGPAAVASDWADEPVAETVAMGTVEMVSTEAVEAAGNAETPDTETDASAAADTIGTAAVGDGTTALIEATAPNLPVTAVAMDLSSAAADNTTAPRHPHSRVTGVPLMHATVLADGVGQLPGTMDDWLVREKRKKGDTLPGVPTGAQRRPGQPAAVAAAAAEGAVAADAVTAVASPSPSRPKRMLFSATAQPFEPAPRQ
jgi:hypothetical protein